MSTAIFVLILIAAVCHATWNAIVKAGTNKFLTTVLVTASAAVLAALLLPFFPMPHRESWPYILASTAIQILYFGMVAKIYRVADMGDLSLNAWHSTADCGNSRYIFAA